MINVTSKGCHGQYNQLLTQIYWCGLIEYAKNSMVTSTAKWFISIYTNI